MTPDNRQKFDAAVALVEADVSPARLRALGESEEWEVRAAVAACGRAPSGVLVALGSDGDAEVRVAVAFNDMASPQALEAVWGAPPIWEARAGLARHPNTPLRVLLALADDEDSQVRREVSTRGGVLGVATAALRAAGASNVSAEEWAPAVCEMWRPADEQSPIRCLSAAAIAAIAVFSR